jgi:5-methylcytosine-specific restriction protein A
MARATIKDNKSRGTGRGRQSRSKPIPDGATIFETFPTMTALFEIGKIYKRLALHEKYGGQRQSGIVTPKKHPFVFLFTGDSGKTHGYDDRFVNGVFLYTGQGQIGHMKLASGNSALCYHREEKKRVFLFEITEKGYARFVSEVICIEYHNEDRDDRNGNPRTAFVFHLIFIDEDAPTAPGFKEDERSPLPTKKLSLAELYKMALAKASTNAPAKRLVKSVAHRAEAIKLYALKRAEGICEGCKTKAPFRTKTGPYLEVHHVYRLTDGGPDHPANVISLCPTCHRRVHYGIDGKAYNEQLIQQLKTIKKI